MDLLQLPWCRIESTMLLHAFPKSPIILLPFSSTFIGLPCILLTLDSEVAKSSRSGCTNAECKKNGDKIEKGALRHGVMVTIQEHQTWKWRHW